MTIYEDAQRQVEQWENHDKFRCCDSDRVLWSNGCEPDEVAIAREVIRLTDALRRVAALGDIGSPEFKHEFAGTVTPSGWRVAHLMRSAALESIGNERSDDATNY